MKLVFEIMVSGTGEAHAVTEEVQRLITGALIPSASDMRLKSSGDGKAFVSDVRRIPRARRPTELLRAITDTFSDEELGAIVALLGGLSGLVAATKR